jgi:5-oxoprolinase (ATP-hydrolysing)
VLNLSSTLVLAKYISVSSSKITKIKDIPNIEFARTYYETICSGSPAGPGFPGTDAVHTHMTNTRLTDPEVLEFRYPVVLEDFHIRKSSGGRGQWNAGDGVRRTIRFLEEMEYTILSGHRRIRPFGLAGGEDGQIGENFVRRNNGTMERLKGADATVVDAGEAIIIQTPTAGGYGNPNARPKERP